jgi:hypothetical protein
MAKNGPIPGFDPPLSIEDKAIAEAVAIQSRARAAYNELADKLAHARERISNLEHEVGVKNAELKTLGVERDVLLYQISSFHTHIGSFYAHFTDLIKAIPGTPFALDSGKVSPDLKALEKQIMGSAASIKEQIHGPNVDDGRPIPEFLQQGPKGPGPEGAAR